MLKIIRERIPERIKEYRIEFMYKDDPEAGFSFPATQYGDPDWSKMGSEMLANYEACLSDKRLTEGEFKTLEWTYMNPALGQCSRGRAVTLECDHAGAVMCECGKWYNLFGQELRDPQYWEEDDEDY
jgi:hypothetical protein